MRGGCPVQCHGEALPLLDLGHGAFHSCVRKLRVIKRCRATDTTLIHTVLYPRTVFCKTATPSLVLGTLWRRNDALHERRLARV